MYDEDLRNRYTALREAINIKYSIAKLLVEYVPDINDYTVLCRSIFNADDGTPSMRLDLRNNRWNDFSSGFKGGYLELKWRIATELKGEDVGIYAMANRILSGDTDIQNEVGFKSLFNIQRHLEEPLEIKQQRPQRVSTNTLNKILKKASELPNRDVLYSIISDLQKGLSEDEIIKYYGYIQKHSQQQRRTINDEIKMILGGL